MVKHSTTSKASRGHFLAATAAASVALIPSRSAAAEYEWKLGHDLPASHPLGVGADQFAAAVKRESRGRMNVSVFPNSILGSDASMIAQVRTGAIQMTFQGVGPLSAIAPLAAIGLVGFLFSNSRQALTAMDGALGAVIRSEIEKRNLVLFEKAWANGFRQVHTGTKAIRDAADMAGLKLRITASPTSEDLFRTLGAAPVPMDISAVYTALQTHLLDGADDTDLNTYTLRYYEVQKYLSITNHQWSSYWLCVNGDTWSSLPPELQAIVRRNANQAGAIEVQSILREDAAVQDLLVRNGMIRILPDVKSFRSQLAGYYRRWKQEFGPAAWSAVEQYTGPLG